MMACEKCAELAEKVKRLDREVRELNECLFAASEQLADADAFADTLQQLIEEQELELDAIAQLIRIALQANRSETDYHLRKAGLLELYPGTGQIDRVLLE